MNAKTKFVVKGFLVVGVAAAVVNPSRRAYAYADVPGHILTEATDDTRGQTLEDAILKSLPAAWQKKNDKNLDLKALAFSLNDNVPADMLERITLMAAAVGTNISKAEFCDFWSKLNNQPYYRNSVKWSAYKTIYKPGFDVFIGASECRKLGEGALSGIEVTVNGKSRTVKFSLQPSANKNSIEFNANLNAAKPGAKSYMRGYKLDGPEQDGALQTITSVVTSDPAASKDIASHLIDKADSAQTSNFNDVSASSQELLKKFDDGDQGYVVYNITQSKTAGDIIITQDKRQTSLVTASFVSQNASPTKPGQALSLIQVEGSGGFAFVKIKGYGYRVFE